MDCDFSPSSPHLLPNGLFSPQNQISFELLALSGLSGFSTFKGGKMLIFQGFANSRIVREFPPFSFKVRIATLTRNAVSRKASRVRIPNSPPKSPVTKRFSGLFFFVRFRKTASKPPQEQPDFRKELRLFCLFRRIRTVKLGSFRRHINFHSIYCQNSPFRATPFRLPLHLPRTVLTSSQDERKC